MASPEEPTPDEPPCHAVVGKLLYKRIGAHPITVLAEADWWRKYLDKHESLFNIPEPVKCDEHSRKARQEGNEFYRRQRYREALGKYNEGICYADAGSPELGLGYGNRSAVYWELGEYELALANIALARGNNYPEGLEGKLRERERNCRDKLDAGQSQGAVPCPRMGINVEPNPKIPFLANQIRMEILPELGRAFCAERDFRPGDVLLDEKSMMAVIDGRLRYYNCSWCSDANFHSLIPCPDCVSYMYCGEVCRGRDRETCHRFECGIGGKLREFAFSNTMFGPRMFFYGLSLFKDDVWQMMEFCKKNARTGGNPLSINFANDDRVQEFKEFVKAALVVPTRNLFVFRFCAAMYDVLFGKHPLVKSLIRTKSQKRFMMNSFLEFSELAISLAYCSDPDGGLVVNMFCSLASVLNHSCDPNAVIVLDAGRIKIVVLRPIRSGEQICITNGRTFWTAESVEMDEEFDFTCRCVVCNPETNAEWRAQGRELPAKAVQHWRVLERVMQAETNNAAKLNALQQYVQRYAYLHPNQDWAVALKVYHGMLRVMVKNENEALARAAALAAADN